MPRRKQFVPQYELPGMETVFNFAIDATDDGEREARERAAQAEREQNQRDNERKAQLEMI